MWMWHTVCGQYSIASDVLQSFILYHCNPTSPSFNNTILQLGGFVGRFNLSAKKTSVFLKTLTVLHSGSLRKPSVVDRIG